MKPIIAGALAAVAALALPAAAAAHPSVYTDTAKVEQPEGSGTFVDQDRYVVANHGFTYVLRETNGVTGDGVFDYKSIPTKLRDGKDWTWLLANGVSGAQAHATCQVAALTSEAAIRGWQGADPFYAYVPFQKDSAGLEDDPSTWIPYVKGLTGVDLATLASPAEAEAACEALPGATYVKADATQSSNAAFNAGLIEHTKAPLDAQIATLTKAVTDANAAKTALQAALDAAKAELVKLATPITVALPSARLKARAFAKHGTRVTLGGVAGSRVAVELAIGERQARKLRLRSSVLARGKATVGADGTASVVLTPSKAAAKALAKRKRAVALTVTARSGDRIASSGATLAR